MLQNTKRKKLRLKKWVLKLFLLFSFLLVLESSYFLIRWYLDGQKINTIQKSVSNEIKVEERKPIETAVQNINPPEDKENDYWDYIKMDMLSVDFSNLKQKNNDTIGWIKVNGTNINYPVVQTTNNSYYLNHAYDKSKNSAGWIYADYRNDMVHFDKNTIIYGHGRLDTTMFGSLKNILSSNWYQNKNNYIVKFSTETENTLWQVFSIYSIKAESYYITTQFSTDQYYQTFLTTIEQRSQVPFSTSLTTNDKILTLSTCKDNDKNRIVLHAKLIKLEKR